MRNNVFTGKLYCPGGVGINDWVLLEREKFGVKCIMKTLKVSYTEEAVLKARCPETVVAMAIFILAKPMAAVLLCIQGHSNRSFKKKVSFGKGEGFSTGVQHF